MSKDYITSNMEAMARIQHPVVFNMATTLHKRFGSTGITIVIAGPRHSFKEDVLPVGVIIENLCQWIGESPSEDALASYGTISPKSKMTGSFGYGDMIITDTILAQIKRNIEESKNADFNVHNAI